MKSKGSQPPSVSSQVQVEEFLKKNTIYCENFKAKITKEQCEFNQTMSTVSLQKRVDKEAKVVKETVSGCKFCKNYNKKIANRDTSISKNGFRMVKRSELPNSVDTLTEEEE